MKNTDDEDVAWFAEFAAGAAERPMSGEELLGLALIFALTGRGDVNSLFDGRRPEHAAFWDRFERFTSIKCAHDDDGWCFFQCTC